MSHDPLCQSLRFVMAEDHFAGSCPWCSKIKMIRENEAEQAFTKGYQHGYIRGQLDAIAEWKWSP